jgi:hypothetical protein
MVFYMTRRFGSVIVPVSWARVIASSIVVGVIAWPLQSLTGVWLLLACGALYALYYGILVLLGEVKPADIIAVFVALPASRSGEADQ